jgi:hypothetical protein
MYELGFRPFPALWKGGGRGGVGFGRVYRRYGQTIPSFRCFMVSITAGMGRFVPMVIVEEKGDATGVWYWKGLPTRTLVFKRQTYSPRYKSCKENTFWSCVVEMHLEITNQNL